MKHRPALHRMSAREFASHQQFNARTKATALLVVALIAGLAILEGSAIAHQLAAGFRTVSDQLPQQPLSP